METKTTDVIKERRQIATLCRWVPRVIGTLLVVLLLPFAIEYVPDLLTEPVDVQIFFSERALS